ncbi:IclR family transcriptional regulator [Streptomyces misionensis]|uniref:IclR family transcriptional regulator n=1 Tax=Streptomyces misionensis TaxID=67331 RepID=UPI0033F80451
MAGNLGTPGVGVAQRLFAVLDCFTPDASTLNLTEISLRSNLPISTTRRLLGDLTEWGALERLSNGSYRIGIRLWEVGALARRQRDLREAALPLMHDLTNATGETTQLAVLQGHEALCVERITASSAVPNKTQVGGRLPLYATGVGKCLLAFAPPELFSTVVDNGLERLTPFTMVHAGRLKQEIMRVRESRIAYSREEMTVGAASVAAPIVTHNERLIGSIGVVVHATANLQHLAAAIKMASMTIARACRSPSLAD